DGLLPDQRNFGQVLGISRHFADTVLPTPSHVRSSPFQKMHFCTNGVEKNSFRSAPAACVHAGMQRVKTRSEITLGRNNFCAKFPILSSGTRQLESDGGLVKPCYGPVVFRQRSSVKHEQLVHFDPKYTSTFIPTT